MLRLFVLALSYLSFFSVNAATDSTTAFNVAQFVRESKMRSSFNPRSVSVSLIHSPTTQTEFAAAGEQGHYISNSSFGFGVRQAYNPAYTLGYNWGATFETIAQFREINVNGSEVQPSRGDSRLWFATLDPSVTYGINGSGYILAGLNYALPLTKNILGTELSGSFGYQVGGGLHMGSRWNVEALYRQINFGADRSADLGAGLTAQSLDRFRYSGLLLRASYALN